MIFQPAGLTRKELRRVILGLLLAVIGVVFASSLDAQPQGPQPKLATIPIIFKTQKGDFTFVAELANTDASREVGLMFRQRMGRREGMIFDWQQPDEIGMWMRNTPLSLDMIFVSAQGRVKKIARDTEPFSLRVIESGAPVKAVIEVLAGTSDEIGLQVGDRVIGQVFGAR